MDLSDSRCTICLETIDGSENNTYKLSCDHMFHTKCIMDWFRSRSSSGNCPLCNDTSSNSENIFYGSKSYYEERFKQIKKYANKNKKNIPELKMEIDKIKTIEKETKIKLKTKKEYLKDNKEIREQIQKHQRDYWSSLRKENKEKMKIIAKYPCLLL
jgi:hypothetical protein